MLAPRTIPLVLKSETKASLGFRWRRHEDAVSWPKLRRQALGGTRHMKELIWQFNVWHFCRKCHPERLVVSLWIQAQRHSTFTYTRSSCPSLLHLQCHKARRTFYVAQHFCGKDLHNFAEKRFLRKGPLGRLRSTPRVVRPFGKTATTGRVPRTCSTFPRGLSPEVGAPHMKS